MVLAVAGLALMYGGLAASQTGAVLPDGSLLKGVEGRVFQDGERWSLMLTTPVRYDGKALDAGTVLELLPSAGLEALVTDAAFNPGGRYRFSAQGATYRGRSSLFINLFVPLADAADSNGIALPPASHGEDPNRAAARHAAEKADPLAIPEDIQKKLAEYQATRQRSGQGMAAPMRVRVLLDQVGLLVQARPRTFFVTDGLGQNTMPEVFEPLPCGTLEFMERVQAGSPEPVRFRVAGVLTEYQGRSFLLLHRAVREYDHGNFGQ